MTIPQFATYFDHEAIANEKVQELRPKVRSKQSIKVREKGKTDNRFYYLVITFLAQLLSRP